MRTYNILNPFIILSFTELNPWTLERRPLSLQIKQQRACRLYINTRRWAQNARSIRTLVIALQNKFLKGRVRYTHTPFVHIHVPCGAQRRNAGIRLCMCINKNTSRKCGRDGEWSVDCSLLYCFTIIGTVTTWRKQCTHTWKCMCTCRLIRYIL